MERSQALKTLRKLIGPEFGYQINPKAASVRQARRSGSASARGEAREGPAEKRVTERYRAILAGRRGISIAASAKQSGHEALPRVERDRSRSQDHCRAQRRKPLLQRKGRRRLVGRGDWKSERENVVSLCVGDWMGLRVGQIVREKGGRHEARVEAIWNSSAVRVTFLETGWIAFFHLSELERVPHLELVKG